MKRLKDGGHSVTDHGDLVSSEYYDEYYDACNDEYCDEYYDEYYDECYCVLDRRNLGADLRRCSSFPREPLSE